MTEDELSIRDIVELVEGRVDDLRRELQKHDYSEEDLEKLLEAEKAAKNRKSVVKLLQNALDMEGQHPMKEERTIGELKAVDYGDGERLVVDIGGVEMELMEEPRFVLAGHVFEPAPGHEGVLEGLKVVEPGNNTGTVPVVNAANPAPQAGTAGNSAPRETASAPAGTASKESPVQEDTHSGVEKMVDHLQEQEEPEEQEEEVPGEEPGTEEDEDLKEEEDKEEPEEEIPEDEVEEDSGDEVLDELEEMADKLEENNELLDDLEDYGFDREALEDKSQEELEELRQEMEEKEEILDELDVDMSDEELREADLEELKQIKQEKDEREELIEELKGKGMDEEALRAASTDDLRRLSEDTRETPNYQEILDGSEQEVMDSIAERDLEDHELRELIDIEKENRNRQEVIDFLRKSLEEKEEDFIEDVEEDLEMLRGARPVEDDREEEEDGDRFQGIEKIQERINRLMEKDEEEDEEVMRDKKAIDLLEKYRKLERNECAIKTAHLMKSYLEHKLEIRREMTYGELAEKLTGVDRTEDLDVLEKFFRKMSRQEYTGQIDIDMEVVMDAAEKTVRNV